MGADVYITHRSMVEVVKGEIRATRRCGSRGPRDPQLEAEMATKLAQKIESEFNPDLKKADLPSTKQAALEKTAGTAAAKAAAPVYKSEIVNGADGKPPRSSSRNRSITPGAVRLSRLTA